MPAAEQHYTGAQGREYHEQKRGIPADAYPWIARLRSEKIQPHVAPGDRVLEFGVGAGWNLALLKCAEKVGHDVAGFLQVELQSRGVRFVQDLAELPQGFADCLICHHTLEHVISPAETLEDLKRWTKPGGRLLLFVPFEKEKRYRLYDSGEPNHHLYSWNVQTLGNLVAECGWSVEQASVARFGYDRFAAKLAVRFRLGEPGFRLIRAMVHLLQPGLEVRLVARRPAQA